VSRLLFKLDSLLLLLLLTLLLLLLVLVGFAKRCTNN